MGVSCSRENDQKQNEVIEIKPLRAQKEIISDHSEIPKSYCSTNQNIIQECNIQRRLTKNDLQDSDNFEKQIDYKSYSSYNKIKDYIKENFNQMLNFERFGRESKVIDNCKVNQFKEDYNLTKTKKNNRELHYKLKTQGQAQKIYKNHDISKINELESSVQLDKDLRLIQSADEFQIEYEINGKILNKIIIYVIQGDYISQIKKTKIIN